MGDARVSLTQPTLQPGLACLTTGEREVRGRDGRKGGGKEEGRDQIRNRHCPRDTIYVDKIFDGWLYEECLQKEIQWANV